MARLEDTLKKIYSLPESVTPTMPRVPMLGNETGAVINDAEVRRELESLMGAETGAVIPNEMNNMLYTREMMENEGPAIPMPLPTNREPMPMIPMGGATTSMMPPQRETGAVINDAELMGMMGGETGAVINDADVDYGFGRPQAMSLAELDAARKAVEKTMSPEELNAAIDALVMQKQGTNDPEELEAIDNAIQTTIVKGNAPYNDLMNQLALTGGEDDMIVHVRTGDVNLSKELITPQIEELIGIEAEKAGIDPETMTYGNGIATLMNEITGGEQHGWLKKTAKSIKKKGRVIAQVASVIPGPWQIPATMATKAYTAYDVAKGNISPIQAAAQWAGANKAAAGAGKATGGNFFSNAKEYITKGDDGVGLFGNIGKTFTGGDAVAGAPETGNIFQRGYEYIMPGQDEVGLFGNIGKSFGMGGEQQPQQSVDDIANSVPGAATRVERLRAEGMSDADIMKDLQFSGYAPQATQAGGFFGGQTPQGIKSIGDAMGLGGASGLRDVYGGGGQGGGGMGGLGSLAGMALAGGIAGKLGKLAYDEAKDSKGVSLSPVVAMDATGRYNLEAEMARRMGQQAPNPTEFGLLPANTFPQLSGGQRLSNAFNNEEPQEQVMAAAMGGEVMKYKDGGGAGIEALRKVAPEVVERMGYNMGGQAMMPMNYNMGGRAMMPMAYAEGGNVAMEDFNRMNGQINGEGTETSDDIPAMLSDGEFVMTGQAVRGAGSYKMKNDSGIVTLTPNGAPNRDSGTEMMYQLMEAFSSRTGPA